MSAAAQRREYIRQHDGGEPGDSGGGYFRSGYDPDAVLTDTYTYRDKNGRVYCKKEKYEGSEGRKSFLWKHWEDHTWVKGHAIGPHIPYRLPELLKASPETPVFICEGEKDCETLAALGFVATCSPAWWHDGLNEHFKGRHTAYVLEDNDQHGRKHSHNVGRNLEPLIDDLRIVRFEDLPEKGDVTEFFESGGTKELFLIRCQNAVRFKDLAIQMREGALVEIVDRAEQGLLDAECPIYQRGGELVRPVRLEKATGDNSVRRALGSTILTPVKEAWLLEQLSRHMEWNRVRALNDGSIRITASDPDVKYVRAMLARVGEWKFPLLTGVLSAPTLGPDGRVIQKRGYDAASGLLLDFVEGFYPSVPAIPKQSDAVAALKFFTDETTGILRGFPFKSDASLAVALAAFLTVLIRMSIGTAPLFGFDAPAAGTGKSMLAEMVGMLPTGVRPPAMAQGNKPEEAEKRLGVALHSGDLTILIDNCERPVEGDLLCSMLTGESVQTRILGQSERRVLPCKTVLIATGNNLVLQGDVSRRAVICRLDAGVERPDERPFKFDAQADLLAERPALVVAGLTALRAYKLAGEPKKKDLTAMGSFPDWDWVRGTLTWCGYADPAETRSAILDNDPKKGELTEIMDLWQVVIGDSFVTVADIADSKKIMATGADNLRAALSHATNRTGVWNSKSVGWWLRRHKDKVIGGRAFRRDDQNNSWQLVAVKPDTVTAAVPVEAEGGNT